MRWIIFFLGIILCVPVIAQLENLNPDELARMQEKIAKNQEELKQVKEDLGITPGMSEEEMMQQTLKQEADPTVAAAARKGGNLQENIVKSGMIQILQVQIKNLRRRIREEEEKIKQEPYDMAKEKQDLENYLHGKEEIVKNHEIQIARTQAQQRLYTHWREKYKTQEKPNVGPYIGVKVENEDFKIEPDYMDLIKRTIIQLTAITSAGRVVTRERLDGAEQKAEEQIKRDQEAIQKLKQMIDEERRALQQGKFTELDRLNRELQRAIQELTRLGGQIPQDTQKRVPPVARQPTKPKKPPAVKQQPPQPKPAAKKSTKPKKKPKIKWWKKGNHVYACSLPCKSRVVDNTGKVTLVPFEKKYVPVGATLGGYV